MDTCVHGFRLGYCSPCWEDTFGKVPEVIAAWSESTGINVITDHPTDGKDCTWEVMSTKDVGIRYMGCDIVTAMALKGDDERGIAAG